MPEVAHGPGFGSVQFGFASAEKEGVEVPDLLVSGFLDDGRLTETALWGSSFLFLGYKGAGKTALCEHARLLAEDRPDLFVTTTTLDRFSYGDFKLVAGGSGEHQVRYPSAWGWLLLVALVHSLQHDEGARANAPAAYKGVVGALEKLGMMPATDLALLVTTSSKKAFKASIPKFLEYTSERVASTQDLQLYQLVTALQNAVLAFPTKSRHVVFVDGLDSVVTQKDLQFQSLAALMQEATDLNHLFKRHGRPFKFVVLCRTDIFERLPGSNINKIRQDDAESLNWYDESHDPDETRLLKLVALRAKRSLGRDVSIFHEYFPSHIDDRDTRKLILDHTRHTPRDLIQALRKIQQSSGRARSLTAGDVKGGLRLYSTEYFIPEVRNDLAGHLEPEEIDEAFQLLASLQRPRVTFGLLEQAASDLSLRRLDVRRMVHALFDASCLGTVSEAKGRRPHYTFKYRNPTATVGAAQALRIHPGALKGLNIQRRSEGVHRSRRGARARR
ncbi:MAG TPA: hypothetical protein VNO82_03495 [Solirubrobacteraceae bacterium]|nr:hypothetical protein [Solirubrobacteraceae bacterium]